MDRSIPIERWIAALSRQAGERLPAIGSDWRLAGDLLTRLAAPVPVRPAAAPPQGRSGGAVEELTLRTDDGLTIAAWFLPAGDREPVVLHHHFGGTRHDYLPVARMLRLAGHPTVLFDARSHGDSDEGNPQGLALAERYADVTAAIDWLRGRGYQGYHCMGYSMGAAVAMLGASHRAEGLRSLVLDSGPVAHLYSACKGLINHRMASDPDRIRRMAARRLYLDGCGWRYGRDLDDAARRLGPTPVLVLHGDRDTVLPPAETDSLRRHVLRGPCERVVLPGTQHITGWAQHRLWYQDLVVDFLRGAEGRRPSMRGQGGA